MATNYEYFKDEIIDIISEGNSLGVLDGRPRKCKDMYCSNCEINDASRGTCRRLCKVWLNAEHIEKPKLTKKERMFCELVEAGWIARDRDGELVHYRSKPDRGISCWMNGGKLLCVGRHFPTIKNEFSFITWDDKEPWSVGELLKLEVLEG